MSPKRAPYARRSLSYLVAVLSIIVVVGFAVAGYEINHLRNETNGLNAQVQQLSSQSYSQNLTNIYLETQVKTLVALAQQGK